jgi:hypothetical protein
MFYDVKSSQNKQHEKNNGKIKSTNASNHEY